MTMPSQNRILKVYPCNQSSDWQKPSLTVRSSVRILLFTLVVAIASPRLEAIEAKKAMTDLSIQCKEISVHQERELNNGEAQTLNKIIRKVESLEKNGLFADAAKEYSKAKRLILAKEGECSVNSGRVRLVYGTKLYRAFRLEEAEAEIASGLAIIRTANNAIKETCVEYIGGLEFLNEIYNKKFDHLSYANRFFEGWPFLKKCLEAQAEATKPAIFNIFIRLSSAFFAGYKSSDETGDLRRQRAELAFDSLNNAFGVVDGRPTEMQLADILLKEGYFKYVMAGIDKGLNKKELLERANEATAQALEIHLKNNEHERAEGSSKQLAYILELLGEQSKANSIYKKLIARALDRPLTATRLNENFTLLSGYSLFAKNWGSKSDFRFSLKTLRRWESLTLKAIFPSMKPEERLKYLNYFSQSEGVASRALAANMINSDEYLDTFLQLRYTLIESELIALKGSKDSITSRDTSHSETLAMRMELSITDYTNQVKKSLGPKNVFVQFVEASPTGYSGRIPKSEIETRTQAFVVGDRTEEESSVRYRLCEADLCESLILDAFAASAQGLSDASEKWEKAIETLFTQQLIARLRGSEVIYLGLDGMIQRIPVGIIRKYLQSMGLGSARLIIVNDLADVGMSSRSKKGGIPTIFYAPNYGVEPQCVGGRPCTQRWSALPYSLKEGQAISSFFDAKSLKGDQASKSSLMSVQNPKFLHVSTHAGFSSSKHNVPTQPSPNDFDDLEVLDGLYDLYLVASGANVLPPRLSILTYKDLAGLDLDGTSLVVISACETGLGGSARGYGLFGMHRILASAGAESTLLSMWKVDDEATSEFMSLFYSELTKGNTLDIALARAQDRMMSDLEFKARGWSHPYYWAGWQLAGDMSPVTVSAR